MSRFSQIKSTENNNEKKVAILMMRSVIVSLIIDSSYPEYDLEVKRNSHDHLNINYILS